MFDFELSSKMGFNKYMKQHDEANAEHDAQVKALLPWRGADGFYAAGDSKAPQRPKLKTTVVFTSVSLLGQWEDECARHAGLDALLRGSDDDDDDERPARPLGAAFLLAGIDDSSSVWLVDAAASPRRWRAKAIGQSSNEADARVEAELRALCERRGFDFPSVNDRAPWSLDDATAIACGVLDALCGEADVAATVVRPVAAVEASTEYDAFAHDDGWEGPAAPVVSALPDDEFRAAVDNLAAQRPTPPGDLSLIHI